jgi:hypothetical protein
MPKFAKYMQFLFKVDHIIPKLTDYIPLFQRCMAILYLNLQNKFHFLRGDHIVPKFAKYISFVPELTSLHQNLQNTFRCFQR